MSALDAQAQVATGTPPFGSFAGGPDLVDLSNLNVHWSFPIFGKAGRGIPFTYALSFDNSIWYPVTSGPTTSWQPSPSWGWQAQSSALTGYVTYAAAPYYQGGVLCGTVYTNWMYYDPAGTPHSFPNFTIYSWGCSGLPHGATGSAGDDSGYQIAANANFYVAVYPRGGGSILPPLLNPNATGTFTVTDSNGNSLSTNNNGSLTTFTDTLCTGTCNGGSTALTINSTNPMSVTYTYTAPNGNVPVTVTYVNYNVRTTFCAPGINDGYFPNTPLVDKIAYPDGSYYKFTYEPTPPLLSG